MVAGPRTMLLACSLLTALAAVLPESHGLSPFPSSTARKMAEYSSQEKPVHRAGRSSHPLIDMQAHWDEYTVATEDPPCVVLPSLDGVNMCGKKMVTLNDRPLAAYQGIKYGESTRFQHSTVAGQYWGDATELNVDHTGPKCSQISMLGHFATGSEDCLFLDIYVPELEDSTEKLPVMFFIHGGSFTGGDSSLYLPTRLLDKDVVLVVIQYRLGALGWLSLQNDHIPGNAGLSDQITALNWVQQHISAFGGDPARVTIFGESAGSASVSLLQTLGPKTKDLFVGVIGESGSALEHWAIDEEPVQSAWAFATGVCGCNVTTEEDLYGCLMAKDHEEITLCTSEMVSTQRENGKMGFEVCSPVVQGETMSEKNRLITKMPLAYIEAGEALDVPLMMGANRDEGSFVFGVMYLDYLVPRGYANDSDYIANYAINDVMAAFGVEDSTHSLTAMVQEKYFPGVDMTSFDDVCPGMIDMVGVFFLKAGTYEVAKLHSTHYNSNTFFYSFDYVSNNSMFNLLFAGWTDEIPFEHGVTHSDELMYLFSFPSQLNEGQLLTSQRMVTLWTNFATYGNPTPDEEDNYSELGLPKWETLDPNNLHYLLIQDEVTVESDYTKRWTIEMDLLNPDGTTTTAPGTTTPAPSEVVSKEVYDALEKKKNDFEITMIVFICLFVVECGFASYFYFKSR